MLNESIARDLLGSLKSRGLVAAVAGEESVVAGLARGGGCYLGIDPTAGSLHLGHLVPIMLMRRLAREGVPTVILVGGATAQVGDPSGRSSGRAMLGEDAVADNASSVLQQAAGLVPGCLPLDNLAWTGGEGLLSFLRTVGSRVGMSTLLRLESLRSRLDAEDGLTFMEAAYPLLQAWDFCHLAERHGVAAQAGGIDQWGNVTMGIDLHRRLHTGSPAVGGLLTPLLLKANGEKMGKTASGATWLSAALTSPYALHQALLSLPDDDARLCLPLLLECDDGELARLLALRGAELNFAKEAMADCVVGVVHGEPGLDSARSIRRAVFGGGDEEGTPRVPMEPGRRAIDAIVAMGLAPSLSAARRLVRENAVTLNGYRLHDENAVLAEGEHGIKVGKRGVGVAVVVGT